MLLVPSIHRPSSTNTHTHTHTHIHYTCTGVGACRPNWRELDDEIMQNSIVIADSREGATTESGDIVLSKVG